MAAVRFTSHPYADALRLMAQVSCTEAEALRALGFDVLSRPGAALFPLPDSPDLGGEDYDHVKGTPAIAVRPATTPILRLLAPTLYEPLTPSAAAEKTLDRREEQHLQPPVLGNAPAHRPTTRPLRRWSSMRSELKSAVGHFVPSRRIHEMRSVQKLVRSGLPSALEFRTRIAWPRRLLVTLCESAGAAPVLDDHRWLLSNLGRELPTGALSLHNPASGAEAIRRARRSSEDRTSMLILDGGDHRQHPDDAAKSTLKSRRTAGPSHVTILLPACGIRPSNDTMTLPHQSTVLWSKRQRVDTVNSELVTRVLELAAIPDRITPGLLRDLVRLVVPGPASLVYELAVWNHPWFQGQAWSVGAIASSRLDELHTRFFARPESTEWIQPVLECLRRWHEQSEHPLVWAMEVVQLSALGVTDWDANEVENAESLVTKAFGYVADRPEARNDSWAHMALTWSRRLDKAVPHHSPVGDVVSRACLAAQRSVPGASLSEIWFESSAQVGSQRASNELPRADKRIELVLRPDRISFGPVLHDKGSGPNSILGFLPGAHAELKFLSRSKRTRQSANGRDAHTHPPFDIAEIRTNRGRLISETITRPPWASNFGRDRFGLFADWTLNGVTQRFRWITPGEFTMGSPEEEPGRDSDEGPQHRVTVQNGFWLGDTPVTQTLWEAGGGENRSEFRSPDRPVEKVSWDGVIAWIGRQTERHSPPPLTVHGLRLPMEAEWEYACRAGTSTALWTGAITLRGENDSPELEDIAWYGGNSGVDFDLPAGADSSKWEGKAHEHTRAGTRRVMRKHPNPHGLYDMLGNVWEWCADTMRTYESLDHMCTFQLEPDDRALRVVRGGSWSYGARFVRAASRFAYPPENAWFRHGFRLARGQGEPERGAELSLSTAAPERVGGATGGGAERRRGQRSGGGE